jgi:N-acetylmuramoyl-L-alanine amidase
MSSIHVVQPGDCLSSIGLQYGFAPETLWEHPRNAELRGKRLNPHVLQPGEDAVFIPDRQPKEVASAADKRHRFIRRGVPEKLRIRLLHPNHQPRPRTRFQLTVDGVRTDGVTDDEGNLAAWIPPNAQSGELIVDPDGSPERHLLQLGHLLPVDRAGGVRQRLENLGYLQAGEQAEAALAEALRAFQANQGLPCSGEADAATRAALCAEHRC